VQNQVRIQLRLRDAARTMQQLSPELSPVVGEFKICSVLSRTPLVRPCKGFMQEIADDPICFTGADQTARFAMCAA